MLPVCLFPLYTYALTLRSIRTVVEDISDCHRTKKEFYSFCAARSLPIEAHLDTARKHGYAVESNHSYWNRILGEWVFD